MGPLDPGKHPESLYWTSYTIWPYFLKSKKNRIFDHQNRCKKIFLAEFSGRCGPATKAIPGINTPHTRPQTPIMLMYEPQPFLPICILKNSLSNAKRHFFIEKNKFFGNFTKTENFGQMLFLLFLLRFVVPRCCFFKSMISQLSFAQKIIKKALLDQKLCQFEFLLWPIYLVIFNVIIYVNTFDLKNIKIFWDRILKAEIMYFSNHLIT